MYQPDGTENDEEEEYHEINGTEAERMRGEEINGMEIVGNAIPNDGTERMRGNDERMLGEDVANSIDWTRLELFHPLRAIQYMRTLPMQRWNTPVWLFGPMFLCVLDGMMLMGLLYLFWFILISPIAYIFSLCFLISILLFRCYIISASLLDELDKLWETPMVQCLVSLHVLECISLFSYIVHKEFVKMH